MEPKEEYSFRVDPRWRWEDTGRIIIGSQDKLSNQLAENAHNIISDLLDKLGVSLLATVADKTANERINQLINHAGPVNSAGKTGDITGPCVAADSASASSSHTRILSDASIML